MAHLDGGKQSWDDDERFYSSGRDSDDSPILSYRYDRHRRYASYAREDGCEEAPRRSTVTTLAKFFLFCTAMILFCVLMYIPVYNRASDQLPKGLVAGWSIHTNRDTKIYVQPNNVTTIHEPKELCLKSDRREKNKLFLLIVVCSSTVNFDRRIAIRETWGNREIYPKMYEVFTTVRNKYKNYNYTYDLYPESQLNVSVNSSKSKRNISIGRLLPELAKALQNNMVNVKTDVVPEEKRFDDEDDPVLPEFDMNKELGDQAEDYDYEYESNVMRIPPRGYEDSPNLEKVLRMLRQSKVFAGKVKKEETPPETVASNVEPEFKLVFLLGQPPQNNDTDVQGKIDEEVEKYGDVIQEGFIDSYNNLTLKSIMMLKWITNKCNESVRYILKTDDDMYINVPNLVVNLKNRSKEFDARAAGRGEKEYLLIGDLICGARPVLDSSNKWYSPRYMYGGRVYPRYLSGTGYALAAPAAHALYAAALRTNYFHLEDIYITGMCALRASPRVVPRDDPAFSYAAGRRRAACLAHAQVTAHRVPPARMRALHATLAQPARVDSCERWRLTQIRSEQQSAYVFYKYLRLLVAQECD